MKLDDLLKDKDAVIFDLDGTLIDSMGLWADIDRQYFGRFGIDLPGDYQGAIAGMSFLETAVYSKERFNLPDSVEKIMQDWNDMAMDMYANNIPLKAGVREFLPALKKKGILTGIATSNSMELVEACLDHLGVRHFFDEVHTSSEVEHGKPFPDIYLLVAKELGVNPKRCICFEDIPEGLTAGLTAGMMTVAVDDEYSKNITEKKKELSTYFIRDYKDFEL